MKFDDSWKMTVSKLNFWLNFCNLEIVQCELNSNFAFLCVCAQIQRRVRALVIKLVALHELILSLGLLSVCLEMQLSFDFRQKYLLIDLNFVYLEKKE